MSTTEQTKLRNVAIIAHVDHGKTTLVDAFLKQSNLFRSNQAEMQMEQILDAGELEREKGITITAKVTAIGYKDYRINIIDTPGHADFGGEVERTLNMADGCLLIVDAQEGPMPQTKFVLKKALELGLKLMVVVNKIDKPFANPAETISAVQDLVLNLATTEDQLEFPIFYASGRIGKAWTELPETKDLDQVPGNIEPLLDAVIDYMPAPKGDINEPLQLQISSLDYDPHYGRYLIGRIANGKVNNGQSTILLHEGKTHNAKIKKLMIKNGLAYQEVAQAAAGEIVAVAGFELAAIGGTICEPGKPMPLEPIKLTPPSVKMKFEANTSPFLGQDGEFVTAKQLQARLEREAEINIGLKITKTDVGYEVAGRGELQLAILIETLRRESFELQVRKPEVVLQEIDGQIMQPREEIVVDVPVEYQSAVTGALLQRQCELTGVTESRNYARITGLMLTAKILGLRNELVVLTKGQAILNTDLYDYIPWDSSSYHRRANGVIISMADGTAMGYSLNTVQDRGDLFIEPGTKVYEGMILGIHKYANDLEVNPTKERQKSGVRMKHDEITQTTLKAVKRLTLEYALVFLEQDEILEITPNNLRLRKSLLKKVDRVRAEREQR